ncbi:MAG: F0F1 ATP synthase subunit delta [Actinomycetes bacterium]|jgi:F-type H+-transporting ATPase subunit delta
MIILGGSSRQSLANLRGTLDEKIKTLAAADCATASADLFRVLTTLNSSIGLRRALTDPSRDIPAKSALITDLFGKGIGSVALELVIAAVSLRWSSPLELADAIEQIAVEAESSAANHNLELDRVQDEIFELSRLLIANGDLRQALNSSADDSEHKQALVATLFAGKFSASTVRLLNALVAGLRGRSIEQAIAAYSHAVAARRNRITAHVRTAIALTPAQREKLTNALTKQIGQPVHVNIEIDAAVIGGVAIRFADEIIDGTIVNRLAEASRELVG